MDGLGDLADEKMKQNPATLFLHICFAVGRRMPMHTRDYHLIPTILFLVVVCCAASVCAQSANDEVLAEWSGGAGGYEVLCKTNDGNLIYKFSGSKSDPRFYIRETLRLSEVNSATMTAGAGIGEDEYAIEVSTQDGAVLRERNVGGKLFTHHNSEARWLFKQKATADRVFEKLKSLTGKPAARSPDENLVAQSADDQVLATWTRKEAPHISTHIYLSKEGMLTCEAKDAHQSVRYTFSPKRVSETNVYTNRGKDGNFIIGITMTGDNDVSVTNPDGSRDTLKFLNLKFDLSDESLVRGLAEKLQSLTGRTVIWN